MSRDGQTLRDYGLHQDPPTDWQAYEECPRCKAERGQPCRDMRYKYLPVKHNWVPHPNRPLTGESSE
jgi:hypothetical protein